MKVKLVRKTITLQQKVDILEKLDGGVTQAEIVQTYGIANIG